MEMYQRADWIVPTFNGELRTDKPPLHYFFMKGAFKLFGVNAFAARIFSSWMGVLTVLSVYLFTMKIVSEKAAFFAALILIASIQLSIQFHLAVPDPYLIFLLTTGWLSFYYGFKHNAKFHYLFYACIAMATLAKGPIAVVFSGMVVVIFLIIQKEFTFHRFSRLKIFEGILIFSFIALPWFIMVDIKTNGEWLDGFLFKHNISRFTKTMEGHDSFPLAPFFIALVGLMPFSFFLPQAIRNYWKYIRTDPFLRFCLISAGTVLVFFSFSKTILPTYPEPAFPFLAIFLGCYFSKISNESTYIKSFRVSAVMYLLITILLPPVVFFVLKNDPSLADLNDLAVYFFILPAGALVALILIVRNSFRAAMYMYTGSSVAFVLFFFYLIFPVIDRENPIVKSKELTEGPGKQVVYYKDFNPAFVFQFQKKLPCLSSVGEIRMLVKQNNRLLVITQERYLPELDEFGFRILFREKDLFEKQVTVILGK